MAKIYTWAMRWPAWMISLLLGVAPAAGPGDGTTESPVSLTELAAAADLVALAQVRDTDYRTRRNIPVSGSAYLKVLIPYKMDRDTERVEIYEKGLHENECYFPNPSVFEEGRRYLVFLVRDAEDPEIYRGLPQGCAIDILVTRNNRYALRYPVTGVKLTDALDELAEDMDFSDPYAIVDDDSLDPVVRDALLAAGHIEARKPAIDDSDETGQMPYPPNRGKARQWRFTRGVALEKARGLIDPEALGRSLERGQLTTR